MENSEGNHFKPEIVENNQNQWKNLFNENIQQKDYAHPQSLVNQYGFSSVDPYCFTNEALIIPIFEKKLTNQTIPLNRVIALDTLEGNDARNGDSSRLPWEIRSHISVNEVRELIRQNKFDFTNTDCLYGYELPGNYYVITGGRHRITAMFLEGVPEVEIKLNKIKNPSEFEINKQYGEFKIQKAIDNGKLRGKIEEDPDGFKKLTLEEPIIKNPLQLFDEYIPEELINVLAQTLSTD